MSASGPTGPEWILEAATDQGEDDLAKLTECARRVWPRLKSFARHALALETSSDEKDRFITEVFEGVLVSTTKTLRKATKPIVDLDAYVAAAFRHEFARRARKEKRLREVVQYLPSDQLDILQDQQSPAAALAIEDKLQLEQIIREMDEWTREVWVARTYGMSWREIGNSFAMDKEQAKQKFRYAIKRIRIRLRGRRP